ncbi:MAG: hypothetical protein ABL958_00525 [Bdellovibrionia bacterium]
MPSYIDQLYQQLVPRGFYYKVLRDFLGLVAGERVRVLNSYYGSNKEDGGFIVIFPDREDLRLHRDYEKEYIENIGKYLEQQEAFDQEAAIAEYNTRIQLIHDAYIKEKTAAEAALRGAIDEGIKRGLSPKDAYKAAIKNKR